jgi:hypothetical protein
MAPVNCSAARVVPATSPPRHRGVRPRWTPAMSRRLSATSLLLCWPSSKGLFRFTISLFFFLSLFVTQQTCCTSLISRWRTTHGHYKHLGTGIASSSTQCPRFGSHQPPVHFACVCMKNVEFKVCVDCKSTKSKWRRPMGGRRAWGKRQPRDLAGEAVVSHISSINRTRNA